MKENLEYAWIYLLVIQILFYVVRFFRFNEYIGKQLDLSF